MTKTTFFTRITSILFLCSAMLGCEDETTPDLPLPIESLTVSSEKVLFTHTLASQKSIELRNPSDWKIEGEAQNWCTLSEMKGTGDLELTVRVNENVTTDSRFTSFLIKTIDNKDSVRFSVSQAGQSVASRQEMDSLILVALYDATNGDNWINNTNWKKGPVNTWYGINPNLFEIEDGDRSRVLQIILNFNNLAGKLPDELYELSALQDLVLSGNNLVGEIPAKISQLTDLQFLNLHTNRFSGPIPAEIGQLSNLRMIYLAYNQLTTVPEEIGDIPGLGELFLQQNQITGTIPNKLFNSVLLRTVDLSNNQLTGTIPPEIALMKELDEDFYVSALTKIDLHNNQLTGSIPANFDDLADADLNGLGVVALEKFDISGNQLSGEIPLKFRDIIMGGIYYPQNGTMFSNYPSGIDSEYSYLLGTCSWNATNLFNGVYEGSVTLELHPTDPNVIYVKGIPIFSGPIRVNMSSENGKHVAKIELPQSGGTLDWLPVTYAYCYLIGNVAEYLDDQTAGTLTAETLIGNPSLSFTGGGISPISYEPKGSIVSISVYPNSLKISKNIQPTTFRTVAQPYLLFDKSASLRASKRDAKRIKNQFKPSTRGLGIQNK